MLMPGVVKDGLGLSLLMGREVMEKKEVSAVSVIYKDGTTQVFNNIGGYHRTDTNYAKGAKHPSEGWLEHQIRWSERQKED